MYCIAILTDQEQEGQNCAEYIDPHSITIHLTSRLMNLSAFSADISVLTEYIFSKIVKKDIAQTIRMNGVHRE